jgi:ribonuclease G
LCQPCPHCDGGGIIKSAITVCYEVFREIRRADNASLGSKKMLVTVHPAVADLLFEEKEATYLEQLEKELEKKIIIQIDKSLHLEYFEVIA